MADAMTAARSVEGEIAWSNKMKSFQAQTDEEGFRIESEMTISRRIEKNRYVQREVEAIVVSTEIASKTRGNERQRILEVVPLLKANIEYWRQNRTGLKRTQKKEKIGEKQ